MHRWLEGLAARLAELRAAGLDRSLARPRGVDFSSNDYLGLSRHARVREGLLAACAHGPVAAPASRLLRGNLAEHEALEARLAAFKGTEAALLFPSGYQANLAVFSALVEPGDLVVSDEQNHASIIDGLRLARCTKRIYPHGDLGAAARALRERAAGQRAFLVTESYFSMDADVADLAAAADLADREDAVLIVDDAHATGLWGEARASGLCEHCGVERRAGVIISTLGKALGLWGAFVAGPSLAVEYLLQRARPFIFSTAPSPLLCAGAHATLDVLAAEPERRARVFDLANRLRGALQARDLDTLQSVGPIVPVVLGANERALAVASAVRDRGFDVRAIRPPSVAAGTARLRLAVHADHSDVEIDALARAVAEGAES